MRIERGFTTADRPALTRLYWSAFGPKLGRVLGPERRAMELIDRVLSPAHALIARDGGGGVIGLIGLRDGNGALVSARMADLRKVYAPLGALWRGAALGLLSKDSDGGRLLIDGLAVAPGRQGQGIGSRLIEAASILSRERGYHALRLDVAEHNHRARALYERRGFAVERELPMGLAGRIFGYRAATVMVRQLA